MKPFSSKRKQPAEPAFDVILKVLETAHAARPHAAFIISLLQQYRERGGLSRKQLEGLHAKASKISEIPVAHLATLQAIIMKKPVRQKREEMVPQLTKEEDNELPMIEAILLKHPAHKQAMLLKMKKEKSIPLSVQEQQDLKRFFKLLAAEK